MLCRPRAGRGPREASNVTRTQALPFSFLATGGERAWPGARTPQLAALLPVSARVPGPFPQTQRLSPGYQEGTKRGLEGPAHLSLAHEANKS